jgi:hypothetical protein
VTDLRDIVLLAHRLLDEAGADHALIGAMALAHLGVHRATMDVDLLVDARRIVDAKSALQSGGFKLLDEGPETLHFGGIGTLDILLARRELSLEMLDRARPAPKLGMKCATAEDIIGLKVQAYVNDPRRRLHDLADIQALIRTQRNLEWERIRRYADLFGEWSTLQALKNEDKS